MNKFFDLKLSEHKNTLDSIKLYEDIDLYKLDLLINSNLLKKEFKYEKLNKIYENEKKQLLNYKKLYIDGRCEVIYLKSKNIYGRCDPKNGLGGHNLRKKIRHTIFNKYIDIDIVNCHPVILQQILDNNNISHPLLKDYIKNRDYYLNLIIDKYNVSREDAKTLIIRLLYGGSYDKWLLKMECNEKLEIILNFEKEIKEYQKIITNNNKDLIEIIKKNKPDKKLNNINGKITSYYLQEKECCILEEIYIYCCNNKYIIDKDCVLCADGIMLKKDIFNNDKTIENLLINLEKHIYNKFNLTLKFIQKEMDNCYSKEEIYNNINFQSIKNLMNEIKENKSSKTSDTTIESKRLNILSKLEMPNNECDKCTIK